MGVPFTFYIIAFRGNPGLLQPVCQIFAGISYGVFPRASTATSDANAVPEPPALPESDGWEANVRMSPR